MRIVHAPCSNPLCLTCGDPRDTSRTCDRLYEVTVLHPVTYRIWAPDAETAKKRAAILRPDITSLDICVGFPESVAVKVIDI